jgi:hypothetical protein
VQKGVKKGGACSECKGRKVACSHNEKSDGELGPSGPAAEDFQDLIGEVKEMADFAAQTLDHRYKHDATMVRVAKEQRDALRELRDLQREQTDLLRVQADAMREIAGAVGRWVDFAVVKKKEEEEDAGEDEDGDEDGSGNGE